jgi:hypothetical protein
MPLPGYCLHCGKAIHIPEEFAGCVVGCPICGEVFTAADVQPDATADSIPTLATLADEPESEDRPPVRRRSRRYEEYDDYDDWEDRRSHRRAEPRVEVPEELPGRVRATAAIVFLVMTFVVELASVPTDVLTSLTIADVKHRNRLELLEYASVGLALLSLGLQIGGTITFAIWMYRAHANLDYLNVRGRAYTSGWAAGAWFVPFMNLFRPCQIAQEIWRASNPEAPPDDPKWWWRTPISTLIGFWWAFWLLGNYFSNFSLRLTLSARDERVLLQAAGYIGAVSSALMVAAAALAIGVIWSIQSRQQAKFVALYGDPDAPE